MFWLVPLVISIGERLGARCALATFALALLAPTLSSATAQGGFNANTYYQQCLRFEAGGDLETARQSCLNALNIRAEFGAATLALARIELGLGKLGEAKARLSALSRNASQSAEASLLLAEIALGEGDLSEAETYLRRVQRGSQVSSPLEARRHFLSGQLAQARRRSADALAHFQNAVQAEPRNTAYRLALAQAQLGRGDAAAAAQTLQSASERSADLLSLLAQAQWLEGDLAGAARNFEAAVAARGFTEGDKTARDLRNLVLVYYGQGDVQRGELALETALRRGDLRETVLGQSTLWLVGFVILLALHLMGESRVEQTSSLEPTQHPEPWTVGQVYRVLFLALISAFGLVVLYGYMRYENLLALLTPLQSAEMRALFLAALALLLAGLSLWRVTLNGWQPVKTLLGSPSQAILGVGLGGLLLAGTFGFQAYAAGTLWDGLYPANVPLLPALVAVLALPFAELFFRAFAIPSLERRYTPFYGVAISSVLYALVLGTPLLLLFVVGVVLGVVYWYTKSGFTPLLTQLTFNVGLLLSASGLLASFF